jgi:hypothetical protein
MDENKWFKLLWRVNAVLVLLVLVAVICSVTYSTVRGRFREPYYGRSNIAQVGIGLSADAVLEGRYGDPRKLPGASRFIVPLNRIYRKSDPSGYRGRFLVNLLFVDTDLGVKRWLLPDNEKHISRYHVLTHGRDESKQTLAILYEIVEESDVVDEETGAPVMRPSLYVSRPDGTGLARVIKCVDRCVHRAVADENHLVIFYVKENMGHAARISLSDFSIVGSTTLQPIE